MPPVRPARPATAYPVWAFDLHLGYALLRDLALALRGQAECICRCETSGNCAGLERLLEGQLSKGGGLQVSLSVHISFCLVALLVGIVVGWFLGRRSVAVGVPVSEARLRELAAPATVPAIADGTLIGPAPRPPFLRGKGQLVTAR